VFHGGHLDRVPVESRGRVIPQRACSGSHSHLSLLSGYYFAPSGGLVHTPNAVFCNFYYPLRWFGSVGSPLHSVYCSVVAWVSIVVGGREYTQVARLQGNIGTPWPCVEVGD
jgi:hypothetical protein